MYMVQDSSADIVILTALAKERDAILKFLEHPQKVNRVYRFEIRRKNSESCYQVVLLCSEAMGNTRSAIDTAHAIEQWNPAVVILTGIAAGVEGAEQWLGDVIIANQIVASEPGKTTDTGTQHRPMHLPISAWMRDRVNDFNENEWGWAKDKRISSRPVRCAHTIPVAHLGTFASGEKVIADSNTHRELQSRLHSLVGIEMESFGVALAVYESGAKSGYPPELLVVKGICDWANPDKNDDWQAYAADVAAAYVMNFIKSTDLKPRSDSQMQFAVQQSQSAKQEKLTHDDRNFLTECLTTSRFSGQFYRKMLCARMKLDPLSLGDTLGLIGEEIFSFTLIDKLYGNRRYPYLIELCEVLVEEFDGSDYVERLLSIKKRLLNSNNPC
jgi:nucleoside phosphorylase